MQVGLTASTASWGGKHWFIVSYVMWWVGTGVMIVIAMVVFTVIAKTSIVSLDTFPPAPIVPFVG